MSRKQDTRRVEAVASFIVDLLEKAIQQTVDERSPEPSRECVAGFVAIDDQAAPGNNAGPAELLATLTLVRWLSLVREELAERPDRADTALAWIEEALGRRYRARARYTAGALRSEQEAVEVMTYLEALQDDFLPSLIWLLAGSVVTSGAGDVGWLRTLDGGGLESPAGFFS